MDYLNMNTVALLVISIFYTLSTAFGRPVSIEQLKDEKLAILRRIIQDMRQLEYVNELFEDRQRNAAAVKEFEPMEEYLHNIVSNANTDKRKMPTGFSAVRGKRNFLAINPDGFSAVRGKRIPSDEGSDTGYDSEPKDFISSERELPYFRDETDDKVNDILTEESENAAKPNIQTKDLSKREVPKF